MSYELFSRFLVAPTAILWAGAVIGVSVIATPVKFTAPSITLPIALDVGRATFHLFSKIEWLLAAILTLSGVLARAPILNLSLIVLLLICLTLQSAWLLPQLDARIASIAQGDMCPPSSKHIFYMVIEIAKLAALLAIGFASL